MYPEIQQAITALLSVCDGAYTHDGQGFNKLDAGYCRWLASRYPDWSGASAYRAWEVLRKYKGQLAGFGIMYDTIPIPQKDAPRPQKKEPERRPQKIIWLTNGAFTISFPYDPLIVMQVRAIPGAKFDKQGKLWRAPLSIDSAEPILRLAHDHGFELADGTGEDIVAYTSDLEKAKEASKATTTEIHIEGLGGTLRPFQSAGVVYGHDRKRCFIADEMGLGKTIQAIGVVHLGQNFPCLVVCPASLKWNWRKEVRTWLPRARPVVISGNLSQNALSLLKKQEEESYCGDDNQEMRDMREEIPITPKTSEKVLRELMRCEVENVATGENRDIKACRENSTRVQPWEEKAGSVGANESKKPHVGSCRKEKDDCFDPKESGSFHHKGGEWEANTEAPGHVGGDIGTPRGVPGKNDDSKTIFQKDSQCIQGRYSRSREDDCDRSGRVHAYREKEVGGFKKGGCAPVFGMGRETSKEQRNNGKPARSGEQVVYIVNYDVLHSWVPWAKDKEFAAVIYDESQALKEHRARRTKAAKAIAENIPVRLALTGTPILNRPAELCSQLDILGRLEEFGGWWKFVHRYCNAHRNRFGLDTSGATHLEELNDKLRSICYVRRSKKEVLPELPDKVRSVIEVDIDNRKEYDTAEGDTIGWLKGRAAQDSAFLASIAHLPEDAQVEAKRQRSNEAGEKAARAEALVRIEALKQLAVKGKMAAIKEWIEMFLESDQKLVVFGHHRFVQDELFGGFPQSARIIAVDEGALRQQNVDRFQEDPECRLIICSLQAGGVGITLTAASNVLFTELSWTPAGMDQATDRCHRIGQKDSVTAWWMIGKETIDVDIAELLESKAKVVNAATDGTGAIAQESMLKELVDKLIRKGASK